jgi:serine O-acetyltransferase
MKIINDLKSKQRLFIEDGANVSLLRVILADGTGANILYRLTSYFTKFKLLFPLVLILQWLNKVLYGCVIGAKAEFSDGFVLVHPIGVVINSKVKGGKNVIIESGVVIGDEKGKSPVLGDNVFIGAGAKVIGNVMIGNNTKIGANAVIVKDVPDGATAVGIPGRILNKGTNK